MDILKEALNDPLRKKYNLNLCFLDKSLNLLVKGSDKAIDEYLDDDKLKGVFDKGASCYGYILGYENLCVVEFKNNLVYELFKEQFPEYAGSYSVFKPNGGVLIFFYSDLKDKPINIVSGSFGLYVRNEGVQPVKGIIETRSGLNKFNDNGSDVIIKTEYLIDDLDKFIEDLYDKIGFCEWPCLKKLIDLEDDILTDKAWLVLTNLLIHAGFGPEDGCKFFKFFSNYNKKRAVDLLKETQAKVKKGELRQPTCKFLRKVFSWDSKDCDRCIRHELGLDNEDGDNKKITEDKAFRDFNIDDLEDLYFKNNREILHGQYFDDNLGLVYSTRIKDKDTVLVLSEDGFGKGIHRDSVTDISGVPEDYFIVEGRALPLFETTIKDMVYLAKNFKYRQHNPPKLSEIYDRVLLRGIKYYLDFKSDMDAVIVTLWVIGTYMRQIFIWYPYLTFYGLRDVGKSTSLSVLSHLCFDGGGIISGAGTESTLLRSAESSKGLRIIDHYEVIRKQKEKKQVYQQFLENAWHLNTVAERTNTNTMEVERYRVSSSVALATRYIDNVLEEKGIVITMVDSDDEDLKDRSSEIDLDPVFPELRRDLMLMSLFYARKVYMKYYQIPKTDGLYGRDRNKFKPFIALAMILEEEGKKGLVNDVIEYGARYREARKEDTRDLEEALLQIIVENGLSETKYSELLEMLREAGFDNVHWQTVRSDLKKLNIGFRTYKGISQRSATIYVDISLARKRAVQRGLFKRIKEEDEEEDEETGGLSGFFTDDDTEIDDETAGPDNDLIDDDNISGGGSNVKNKVLEYIKMESTDSLGVGVGSILKHASENYGLDVDEARGVLMELVREGKIYEHVIGYFKPK